MTNRRGLLWLLVLPLGFLTSCRGCVGKIVPVLGPTDKPDFGSMKWKKLRMCYWVLVSKNRRKLRMFRINDPIEADKIRQVMGCRDVRGHSTGAGPQMTITMADGEVWQGSIVFEDRVKLCLQRNPWYSYHIDLADTAFYDRLVDACLAHEKTITPTAIREHIIVRSNLTDDSYKIIGEPEAATSSSEAVHPPTSQPTAPAGRR